MLIYIRHSDDNVLDPTYACDGDITPEGRILAINLGNKLLHRYGLPDTIYCSPFKRTRETLKYMLKDIPMEVVRSIKIVFTQELGRYFQPKQRSIKNIRPSTQKLEVNVRENWRGFENRVDNHIRKTRIEMKAEKYVWCITHAIVYKRVAKHYGVSIPQVIPPVDYYVLVKSGKYRQQRLQQQRQKVKSNSQYYN